MVWYGHKAGYRILVLLAQQEMAGTCPLHSLWCEVAGEMDLACLQLAWGKSASHIKGSSPRKGSSRGKWLCAKALHTSDGVVRPESVSLHGTEAARAADLHFS